MPDGAKWDYLIASHQFVVDIDSTDLDTNWTWLGSFQEVSGLSVSAEPETFREGGENQFEHKRPGAMSWPNITLKRGVVYNDGLFEWFSKTSGDGYDTAAEGGPIPWTSVMISLVTKQGDLMRSWVLDRAFPIKWTGPSLVVSANDVATEELEIAHHGFISTSF